MNTDARRQFAQPEKRLLHRIGWSIVCVFTVIIPLYISGSGEDVFRLPKELLFRLEATLLASILVIGVISKSIRRSDLRWNALSIAIASTTAVALTATLASTNHPLSVEALGYFSCCLIVFISIYMLVGDSRGLFPVLAIGTAAAIPNAVLAIMQRFQWWTPFHFDAYIGPRLQTTALIGNPNDVGAVLTVCAIPAATYVAVHPRSRLGWLITTSIVAGVFAADALTSMIALGASVFVLFCIIGRGHRLAAITLLGLAGAACLLILPPLRARLRFVVAAAQARDYETLTSHRFVAWNAAFLMFRDRPLFGLGPGTFRWHYLPYRIRVEQRHPDLYLKTAVNYGEVHSDHLQILAEEGLLGYAVFLGNIGLLATRSLRRGTAKKRPSERTMFAFYAAGPLATALLFLAAAGFPLELSAVMTPLLFFAAVIMRWSAIEKRV